MSIHLLIKIKITIQPDQLNYGTKVLSAPLGDWPFSDHYFLSTSLRDPFRDICNFDCGWSRRLIRAPPLFTSRFASWVVFLIRHFSFDRARSFYFDTFFQHLPSALSSIFSCFRSNSTKVTEFVVSHTCSHTCSTFHFDQVDDHLIFSFSCLFDYFRLSFTCLHLLHCRPNSARNIFRKSELVTKSLFRVVNGNIVPPLVKRAISVSQLFIITISDVLEMKYFFILETKFRSTQSVFGWRFHRCSYSNQLYGMMTARATLTCHVVTIVRKSNFFLKLLTHYTFSCFHINIFLRFCVIYLDFFFINLDDLFGSLNRSRSKFIVMRTTLAVAPFRLFPRQLPLHFSIRNFLFLLNFFCLVS